MRSDFTQNSFSETAMKTFVNFLKREDGPTAVEYAVMLALIIVVCLGAIAAIGTGANSTFETVQGKLTSSSSS
jgi:pilus assembly protein Flp/PilA